MTPQKYKLPKLPPYPVSEDDMESIRRAVQNRTKTLAARLSELQDVNRQRKPNLVAAQMKEMLTEARGLLTTLREINDRRRNKYRGKGKF